MVDRKRRRPFDEDRDIFDEFFGFPDIDDEFERMRRTMEGLLERSMKGEIAPSELGPYVYGFTMRVGPDGKPIIHQFGNKPPLPYGAKPEQTEEPLEREPLTDVIEGEKTISVTIELPGVEKKDIQLNVHEKTIRVDVDAPKRKYHKEIPLPADVAVDKTKATYNNGVLDITLEKVVPKELKGRKIDIH